MPLTALPAPEVTAAEVKKMGEIKSDPAWRLSKLGQGPGYYGLGQYRDHQGLYRKAELLRHCRIFENGRYGDGNEERLAAIEEEISVRISITKREIFVIGELLYEAKKIKLGEFKRWIEETFDFSYYTANNFMNVYKALFGYDQLVSNVKPSILYSISAPSFPEELRHYLVEEGILEQITNKGLKELYEKYIESGFEDNLAGFERFTQAKRCRDQCAHTLNVLVRAISLLQKQKDLIMHQSTPKSWEGYKVQPNLFEMQGQDQIAEEMNHQIYDALEDCITHLWKHHDDCVETLNRLFKEGMDALQAEG